MKQKLQLILLGLALCLSTWSWGQTLNETFDGPTIPAGWTTQQVAGTANWTFGSGTMPTGIDFTTNAAIIDVDANGDTAGLDEAYLLSPVLNTTTLTNGIELSFDYSLQDYAGDGDLEAEVFDGTNWISIFSISVDQNPTTFPFTNVSAYSNANFQIRFRYDDDGATTLIWGAGIDNVVLREAPSCIVPDTLTLDSATTTTATVSWTSGGSGESAWDIEVGPTGFTPTGVPTDPGVSNPATLIGLSPGTYYDFYVRADCTGGDFSDYAGPFTLTTACVAVSSFNEDFDAVSTPDLPVCWDNFATTPSGSTAAYVETSTLADNTAPNGVRLYSGSLTGNIGSGTADEGETILVSPELSNLAAGTHRIRFSADAGTSTSTLEVGTMTDPTDPLTFTNLMAIAPTTTHTEYIVDFDSYAGTDVYIAFRHIFAGTFDSMYLDDIVWEAIPSCLAPSALTLDSATPTSATLSWTSGGSGEAAWDIELGPEGFTPTGTPTDPGVSNPATINGLSANTSYDYYVRANCGGGDVSVYAGPYTFRTACGVETDFNEDFDSVSTPNLAPCWDSFATTPAGTTAAYVETSTLADNTAPNGVRMYSGSLTGNIGSGTSDEGETILISPELSNLGAGTHRIRFSADSGTATSTLEVGTMTDPNDPLTFTNLMAIAPTTTHSEYIVDFDSYAGTDVYIAFRHIFAGTFDSMYLDDIVWEAIPACVAPTDLTSVSASDTEVNIAWTNNAGAAASTVIYGAPGFDPTMAGTSIAGGALTATISALTAETDYDVYVIQDCSGTGNGTSSIVGPLSVSTACAAIAAPYSTDFENFTAALSGFEEDQCWREVSPTAYDWAIDTSGGTSSSNTGPDSAFSGTNFMFVEATNGNDGDVATVLSPAIDLTALTNPSVSFYYHMYGAFITDLTVGVSTDNGATFTNELTLTGQQQTASSDPWEQVFIDLSGYAGQTVVVSFTTSKSTMPGNTYEGDIAIDDVSFDEAPSCFNLTNLSLLNNTDTEATINFDSGNGTIGGDYEYSLNTAATATPAVTAAWSDTGGTSGNVTYTIGSLLPETEYFVYVREVCGPGDESEWSAIPVNFTTDCSPFLPDYLADMSVNVPNCWEEADNGNATTGPTNLGSGLWTASNHNGTPSNRVNLFTNTRSDWIITPTFDLSAPIAHELNVYVALTESTTSGSGADLGSDDRVSLLMTIDNGVTWTEMQAWTQGNVPTDIGEEITYDLTGITGNVKFAFLADEGSVNDPEDVYFHVSKFQVRATPSCPDTSNLTLVTTTDVEAIINFDSGNATSAGNYEYSLNTMATATPAVTGSWTDVPGANPNVTYTIDGLTAQTDYFIYVREVCAIGDESAWSTVPLAITTGCPAVTTYPYVTDFTTNPPNGCWDEAGSGEIANGPMGLGTSDWKDGRSYENSLGNQVPSNVINLYQSVDREWLISERYDMTGTSNDVLTVEVAVTDYTFSGASDATDTDTMGSDDQVDLVISTDNGATWTSIFSWDVSNQPSVTGSREIIDLSSYSGMVKFAFFASDGTTDDLEDYDFHVGLFTIDATAGIIDTIENNVSLFPNPTSGDVININFDQQPSGKVELRIINALGQLVRREQLDADGGQITLNGISSLSEGMYFLQISNAEQQSTLKFIKN